MKLFHVECTRNETGSWDDNETHIVPARSEAHARKIVKDRDQFDKTYVSHTSDNHQISEDEGVHVNGVREITEAEAQEIRADARVARTCVEEVVRFQKKLELRLTNRMYNRKGPVQVELPGGTFRLDPETLNVEHFVGTYGIDVTALVIDEIDKLPR